MLAETRRRALDTRRGLIKFRGGTRLPDTPGNGVVVFVYQIVGLNLGMSDYFFSLSTGAEGMPSASSAPTNRPMCWWPVPPRQRQPLSRVHRTIVYGQKSRIL